MKLASLKHGRDGRLVVVSRDLTRATDAFPVVATLQGALDDWDRLAPRLADLAESLEHGAVPSFRFHEHYCASPLPRAYQRLDDGTGGTNAPEAIAPMRQRRSDGFLGPRQPIHAASEDDGIAFHGSIAVIAGDVPQGTDAAAARDLIRLVMLACDTGVHGHQSESIAAFSPVAVTCDELGPAWDGGRLHHPLQFQVNGKPVIRPDTGMAFDFGTLICHAAATRALGSGAIIGSGSFDASQNADQPMPYLRFGDTIRIEIKDAQGHSIFGAIEQEVLPLAP